MHKLDVLFVNPGNAKGIYQGLATDYAAIEPPTWALLLAGSIRNKGHKVGILDINAERISNEEATERIKDYNPKLICFVVYGQNVNAGTVGMSGAVSLSNLIKEKGITNPISYIGSYIQALPIKCLEDEPSIDFGFTNEGLYSILNVLKEENIDINNMDHIKGIVWRKNGTPIMNSSEKLVSKKDMDTEFPGYAWDLLPFKEKPLDLYRAPMWHAEYNMDNRTPYAALQTSLGCQFACEFCMINIINRDDEDEIGVAGNYSLMRYWSPEYIIKEFDKLIEMGVRTIRITDEMFLLRPNYYIPLCKLLKERNDKLKEKGEELKMWAYSRVDTLRRPEVLKLVKEAGIKWLCLGIESADKNVRLEVSKGRFEDVNIVEVDTPTINVNSKEYTVSVNYMGVDVGDVQYLFNYYFDSRDYKRLKVDHLDMFSPNANVFNHNLEEYETNNLSSIDDDNEISDTDQTSEVIDDQEETTDDSWYEE